MASPFRMKNVQRWLRWLLSIALFLFLFYTIDLQEAREILVRSQPSYLLLAFIVALGDRLLMAYKWTLLLRAKGMMIPVTDVIGTYWVSTFLGLFLPATVGGDALRAYAVAKGGYRTSDVISSIVIERALGFIALFIFVLVGIAASVFVFGEHFFGGIWNLFWLFALLLVVSTGAVYLSLNTTLLQGLNRVLERPQTSSRLQKIIAKLRELYHSYVAYRHHRSALFAFLALSLVENLFPLFWTYLLARAFAIDVPLLYFFILVPIVLVLVRLPISLDGFGIQEGAFVFFLALIAIPRSEAFLLGIASHILAILSLLPGGLLYGFGGLTIRNTVSSEKGVGEIP